MVSPTQINLSWDDNSTFETGFQAESSTDGVNFVTNATLTAGVTNTLVSVTPGTTYYFRVRTTSSAGNSGFLMTNSFLVTVSGLPPAPSNVVAVAVSSSQINVTWSPASGASGYYVDRNGSPVAMLSATNYSDAGLTPGTLYSYTVVATNNLGNSTPSAPALATTTAALPTILVHYTFGAVGTQTDPVFDSTAVGAPLVPTNVPTVTGSQIVEGADNAIGQSGDSTIALKTGANRQPAKLSILAGVRGNSAINSSTATGTAITTALQAETNNCYFTFIVSRMGTNTLNLASLSFNGQNGGSGLRGFSIQESVDGWSTNGTTDFVTQTTNATYRGETTPLNLGAAGPIQIIPIR